MNHNFLWWGAGSVWRHNSNDSNRWATFIFFSINYFYPWWVSTRRLNMQLHGKYDAAIRKSSYHHAYKYCSPQNSISIKIWHSNLPIAHKSANKSIQTIILTFVNLSTQTMMFLYAHKFIRQALWPLIVHFYWLLDPNKVERERVREWTKNGKKKKRWALCEAANLSPLHFGVSTPQITATRSSRYIGLSRSFDERDARIRNQYMSGKQCA